MKEAFWGVLIILLGLFGIVVVNLFQNVMVDNDRVYYLIKESTEASAYDSIDLTYYRLSGNIRIVEDKFVENLTRRFAQNVTIGNYKIVVQDINEVPPKISLFVRSGITSFGIGAVDLENKVNAVIEAKYKLEDVLEFLCGVEPDLTVSEEEKITYEECRHAIEYNLSDKNEYIIKDEDTNENICLVRTNDTEIECLSGDIKFTGFESTSLKNSVCRLEISNLPKVVARTATYKTCECGKWSEEKRETVYASPIVSTNNVTYTWNFKKDGELRNINETVTKVIEIAKCVEGIKLDVPKDLSRSKKYTGLSDPTKHSATYINCPSGGIEILKGASIVLQPTYNPKDATERKVTWKVDDTNILSLSGISNPLSTCEVNKDGTNCKAKAIITAKNIGTTTVTVTSQRGHTSTCKVKVWSGDVDTVGCNNLELVEGKTGALKRKYTPSDAVNINFTYTSSNTNVATINSGGTVTAKSTGSSTITVKSSNGKIGTCTVTVKKKPTGPPAYSGGCTVTYRIWQITGYEWKYVCRDVCTVWGGRNKSICLIIERKCKWERVAIGEWQNYSSPGYYTTSSSICRPNGKAYYYIYCRAQTKHGLKSNLIRSGSYNCF